MGFYRAADSSDILLRAPRSLLLLLPPVVLDPFLHVHNVVESAGRLASSTRVSRGRIWQN